MANWKLYTQDVAAGLYSSCSDTGNTGTAHYAVDGNLASVWTAGSTADHTWTVSLGASRTVKAVGIAGHNMYGDGTILVTVASTPFWTGSAISGEDMLVSHSGISGSSVSVRVYSFTVTPRIGVISVLTDASTGYGIIDLAADTGGPVHPIGVSLDTGVSVLPTASSMVYQGMRRPARTFSLNLQYLRQTNTTGSFRRIDQSLRLPWAGGENYGWRKGIWITTDEYDTTTDPRGYYVRPIDPSSAVAGSIIAAGGITSAQMILQEFPRPI